MNLNGYKVVVKPPARKFKKIWRQAKSKAGKRWVKVKRFTGWVECLRDGEVVEDRQSRTFYMTQKTYHEFKKAAQVQERKQTRFNPSSWFLHPQL